jgi:signal transduction histidine kinase
LADAVADERFARDVYLRGIECCSLMVVPILMRGTPRAMLMLENRSSRNAFSTARLDAVLAIAGQLAVSLESARLYEQLERKVQEQTQQLREAQSRLLAEARRAGMAQIATNVLHNVGNVLTSVNVSAHMLAARVKHSRAARVDDLAQLLHEHEKDLPALFASGNKGQMLPQYVQQLSQALSGEREEFLQELGRLGSSVEHIKNVVAMQQSYAGASGLQEPARPSELIDDALRIQETLLARQGVRVERHYEPLAPMALDKTRVMQVLVNLIENACHAMEQQPAPVLRVSVAMQATSLQLVIADNGCGLDADSLTRIFAHGFTTRAGGHGFGLHSCALAAREMNGSLTVHSDGPGLGAAFTLQLPGMSDAL